MSGPDHPTETRARTDGPSPGDINVWCTDLDRSLAFYRDALGLPEVEREGGAVRLSFGGVGVLLLPFADSPRRVGAHGREASIGFDVLVDHVADTVARLEGAGGTRLRPVGGTAGWAVADPDGNVIEVIGRRTR